MQEVFRVFLQMADRSTNIAVSKSAVLLFIVFSSLLWEHVAAVWSVEAMEQWKASEIWRSRYPSLTAERLKTHHMVAVFYGSRKERLLQRECEKLKCEFIASGCITRPQEPPPPFICFSIWNSMRQPSAGDCPYKPCEGYNQQGVCVADRKTCGQGQGELVPFGLCKDYNVCCLFPVGR